MIWIQPCHLLRGESKPLFVLAQLHVSSVLQLFVCNPEWLMGSEIYIFDSDLSLNERFKPTFESEPRDG